MMPPIVLDRLGRRLTRGTEAGSKAIRNAWAGDSPGSGKIIGSAAVTPETFCYARGGKPPIL